MSTSPQKATQMVKQLKNELKKMIKLYSTAEKSGDLEKVTKLARKIKVQAKGIERLQTRVLKQQERKKTRKIRREAQEKKRAERAKTRKARQKSRKIERERGRTSAKIYSPGKTMDDYIRVEPHFQKPSPTPMQRALELTSGQGIKVSPKTLQKLAAVEEQKRKVVDNELQELEDEILLEELEQDYQREQADKAAQEYVDYLQGQPSPTPSEIEEMMTGGKKKRKRHTRRKRKTNKKTKKKSRKKRRRSSPKHR